MPCAVFRVVLITAAPPGSVKREGRILGTFTTPSGAMQTPCGGPSKAAHAPLRNTAATPATHSAMPSSATLPKVSPNSSQASTAVQGGTR